MINQRDFKRGAGIDFTGLPVATGGDHNDLIDGAEPYQGVGGTSGDGTGIIIMTTDTAYGAPVVPNPADYAKWERYLWKRNVLGPSSAIAPILYMWSVAAVADPTYLQWVPITNDTAAIENEITALKGVGWTAAQTVVAVDEKANTALATANTANDVANSAQLDVNNLEAVVGGINRLIVRDNYLTLVITNNMDIAIFLETYLAGRTIYNVQFYIKCYINDGTFVVGQMIPIECVYDGTDHGPYFSIYYNAAGNARLATGGGVPKTRLYSGLAADGPELTMGSWRLHVRAITNA